MNWIRMAGRLTAFTVFLTGTCLLAIGLRVFDLFRRQPADRNPWAALCFRRAGQCLGWKIQVVGELPRGNALYVANHISWSDIPALGAVTPLKFLSKAEVGQWPVIGWLAREAGTLFIKRGGGQARRIRGEMVRQLRAGQSVLVFPEGTTSTGLAVLPMHGLLLSAAREAGVPIQPVTIGYRRNGRPDALAPFVGNDSFHRHLVRLLRQAPARITLVLHPAIDPNIATSELVSEARQAISAGLARIHSGEFDRQQIRTGGAPGQSRRPLLPGDLQFPDQNTG